MNVLIVEDDQNKIQQIAEHLRQVANLDNIDQRRSYQSGMDAAINGSASLIILDMSMPTFDITPSEQGGRMRPYAGRDIIRELSRRRLRRKVIVVTQFETFREKGEVITLSELRCELSEAFPDIYIEAIYYSAAELSWTKELDRALEVAVRAMQEWSA